MNRFVLAIALSTLAFVSTPVTIADVLVNVGSPDTPFPRNKQNEPAVAIDPANPMVLAAGANDEIDLAPCVGSDCPFTPGVGVSGVYFSFDGGASWIQPNYTGYSARGGTPGVGPIGTVPNYFEKGLVNFGDPSLAFGPRPDAAGRFSWDNGSRLYYANLAANFSTERGEQTYRGFMAIAVAHADDLAAAAAGVNAAWSEPVLVAERRQSETTFSDKEYVWADNAASSPHFGNAYVCWVSFRSNSRSPNAVPEPLMFSRSTDGGASFSNPRQLTPATNNPRTGGRQGCVIRTDSEGVVYLFYEGADRGQSAQLMIRSFDGGASFERPRPVAAVVDVGAFDPVQGRVAFDGVAGARTNSFPSASIANGAPSGTNAPDTLVLTWPDARNGLNNEEALFQYSTDKGESWSAPVNIADEDDRPDFPWVAISPDGKDVYLTYNGFVDPFRDNLTDPRRFRGVVRHGDFAPATGVTNLTTLHRGMVGDGRASSANNLMFEFLGDYNFVVATDDYAAAVWIDARTAAVCQAINDYRASLLIPVPVPKAAPATDCPPTFGDTDIYGEIIPDPTP